MNQIGILAYGSLIQDPGSEIAPAIVRRIKTVTPFPVEYGRLSNSRGDGPTVVPHTAGQPVSAEILVLKESVSLAEATDMLWRREVRQIGSGKRYRRGTSPNSVLVEDWSGYEGIAHVLYTDFLPAGKIPNPTATDLARAAVASVTKADAGKDGISYLIQLIASGVETRLTEEYCAEIIRLTGTNDLGTALAAAQRTSHQDQARLNPPLADPKCCHPPKVK